MKAGDFTQQAGAYARSRPGYPAELVAGLIALTGVRAGDAVCDVGAGTGAFTRVLSRAGLRVTAIEPGREMRARAETLPGVVWKDATFEATGLASESQDWVVCAQSFHWARIPDALAEIRRILRPGGYLSCLWNERENDAEATLSWTWSRVQALVPGFEDVYKTVDWERELESTGAFRVRACHAARQRVPMDRRRFADLWRSHQRLNQAAGREGVAALIAELEAHLERNGINHVEVPYLCRGWTAQA